MKLNFVIIDDVNFFLSRWEHSLRKTYNADVFTFSHPIEFYDYCYKNKGFAEKINVLVTDRKTPGFDVLTTEFIHVFKSDYPEYKGKTYLCSSLSHYSGDDILKHGFDGTIKKREFKLPEGAL